MAEKSGVHLTGADSGWPVASSAEPDPRKDGTGADPHSRASSVAVNTFEVNERQKVVVDATGGTFTLTYSCQTSGNIDFDATPAEVVTALEALSNVGSGDVAVTGGPGNDGGDNPYYVTFQGALEEQNVAQMTGDDTNLTGGGSSVTITTTTPGS